MGERMLQADITALREAVVVEQASVMEMKVDRRVFRRQRLHQPRRQHHRIA